VHVRKPCGSGGAWLQQAWLLLGPPGASPWRQRPWLAAAGAWGVRGVAGAACGVARPWAGGARGACAAGVLLWEEGGRRWAGPGAGGWAWAGGWAEAGGA
jgi:hypothetical protein